MVPVNHDIYGLRNSVCTEIFRRLEAMSVTEHPIDGGWLLYAVRAIGSDEGSLFDSALGKLEKWAVETAGDQDRDLGPLCICEVISGKDTVKEHAAQKVEGILSRALKTTDRKFSVLNDPDQVFCASLLKERLSPKTKKALLFVSKEKATGRISRKVMYYASAVNLGGDISDMPRLQTGDDVEDLISLAWFGKRYLNHNVSFLWDKFELHLSTIQIGAGSGECRLSGKFLALLADAISLEIEEPNPNMLFDIYPFVPELKKLVDNHFKQGKYLSAVFEATKKLNEFIQQKTNSTKAESELIQSTMRLSNNRPPIIQFNECLNEVSGKNEQSGLALIAEGIFRGLRNPKGHKPEDHELVKISAYECLSQLIIVDYIWKKVADAKIVQPDRK